MGAVPAQAQLGPPPYLEVGFQARWEPPASDSVVGWGWDEGTSVSLQITRGGEVLPCDQTVMVEGGAAAFNPRLNDDFLCNPQPGDLLRATGAYDKAEFTREYVLQPSKDSGGSVGADVDVAGDVVSGVVPGGSSVEVSVDLPDGSVARSQSVPEGQTTYSVDLTGLVDVQAWTELIISVSDIHGDVVTIRWPAGGGTVQVTPDTGLVNGQVVSVTGEGFPPGTVTLAQGHGFIGGIDTSTYSDVAVAADGTFAATFPVERVIRVPTGTNGEVDVDCAAVDSSTGLCFLVAFDDPWAIYLDTTFRLPYVTVSVGPLASVDRLGRATVVGSLDCDASDTATIAGTVTQGAGRKAALGTFAVTTPCTQRHWVAVVRPSGRTSFGPGLAKVRAQATITVWGDGATDTAGRVVLLVPLPWR